MAGRLEGKRAFVAGAGQGIGRAAALAFAREGATVFAATRTAAKLAGAAASQPSIRPVALDVTDGPALKAALAEAGEIDVLFNGVGWVHSGSLLDCDEDDWALSFAVNVTPMYRAIRAVLPGMIARKRGAIINVASVASSISGVAGRAAYGASKAALIALLKSYAAENPDIAVDIWCPPTTKTRLFEEAFPGQTTMKLKTPAETADAFMQRLAA